jgi:hypothetical protein
MKDVPAVPMPMPLADLCHPERWPMRGRSDPTTPSPAEASFTPSADQPEEVPGNELLGEADDQGSE